MNVVKQMRDIIILRLKNSLTLLLRTMRICLANERVNSLHARRMRRTATFSYAQNRLAIVIADYRNTRAVFYFRLFPPSVYFFFSLMQLGRSVFFYSSSTLLLHLPFRLYTHFRFGFILIGRATTSYSSRANASLYLFMYYCIWVNEVSRRRRRDLVETLTHTLSNAIA